MKSILKVVNKFNGNLFFILETENQNKQYLFEVNRQLRTMNYAIAHPSEQITGVCQFDLTTYLLAYGNQVLGIYEAGAITRNYLTLPFTAAHKIFLNDDGTLLVLDKNRNALSKTTLSPVVKSWAYILPNQNNKDSGDIKSRQSDSTIVYNSDSDLMVIRDDDTSAVLLSRIEFGDPGLRVEISGEHNPHHSYLRWKAHYDEFLNMSSSSTESSSSSSSSSSGSSSSSTYWMSTTSSSTCSSFGYSESSQSSSSSSSS